MWGKTVDKAFQTFPDAQFIVHNGDFTEEPEDSAAWDSLWGNVQSLVASVPLMPVTGNHDEAGGVAAGFTSHFNLPDNGAKGSIPGTSYSFDVGPVHMTVLNTESNLKKQAGWLKQDLAGTDKPWKIIAMHRPAYGGNIYRKVEEWTAIFDKYQVDLVLQGHNHEYSRSYYTIDGEQTQNFFCDWSQVGSANVTGSFVKMPSATTGADYYLELGFSSSAGALAAGASIDIQARVTKSDWTHYTQTGDYSFNGADTHYADWSKAPAYISGTLVWGDEPS